MKRPMRVCADTSVFGGTQDDTLITPPKVRESWLFVIARSESPSDAAISYACSFRWKEIASPAAGRPPRNDGGRGFGGVIYVRIWARGPAVDLARTLCIFSLAVTGMPKGNTTTMQ